MTSRSPFWRSVLVGCALTLIAAVGAHGADTTLRVGVGPDRYNTDPKRFSFTMRAPNTRIGETPVRPDAAYLPEPLLFESWSLEDGVYRATLRQGAVFHDGKPLTADSFVAAMRTFIATRDFIAVDPDSIAKIDERTITFKSSTGSALTIENMAHALSAILSPEGDPAKEPIGTGPYRFVRYQPKSLIEVARNDAYWGPKPYNERIVYRFIDDPQARLLALVNGELDLVTDVVPQMLLALPPDDRLAVHLSRPVQYAALLVNINGKPPFDKLSDIRVRRALALSIDRNLLAKVLYLGKGVPARGLLPGWMFGLGDEVPKGFGYDPAAATALLDEAGWVPGPDGIRTKNGTRLVIRLLAAYPVVSTVKPMPEMLVDMFKKVGIGTELIELEDEDLYYSAYVDKGEVDVYMEFASNNNTDPTYLLYNLFHSKTPWTGYVWNAPGAAVDQLLSEARAGRDRDEVIDKVREAQRLIVDEAVAAIPILMVPNFVLTRPGVEITVFEHRDWVDVGNAKLPD